MPPVVYESAMRWIVPDFGISAFAPTGMDTMLPPLPDGSSASMASEATSLRVLVTATSAVGVTGIFVVEESSTEFPPVSFSSEFAPTTSPEGSITSPMMPVTTAAIARRLRLAGIALMPGPGTGRARR